MRKSRATGESSTTRTLINSLLLTFQGAGLGSGTRFFFPKDLRKPLRVRSTPTLWPFVICSSLGQDGSSVHLLVCTFDLWLRSLCSDQSSDDLQQIALIKTAFHNVGTGPDIHSALLVFAGLKRRNQHDG